MNWKSPLLAFLLLITTFFAFAAPTQPLSTEEHNKLVPSRICLDNAAHFQKKGMLAAQTYDQAVAECLSTAKTSLGRDITFADLTQKVGTSYELTGAQKVAGMLSAFSVMQIIFAVVGTLAGAVFLFHLVPVFTAIPIVLYEFIFYGASLYLTFGGLSFASGGNYAGLVGSLGFGASLMFTGWVHKIPPNPVRFFGVVMLYSGLAAFLHQSPMIGYVTILSLLCMGGFAASMGGLCYMIGFANEAAVPRGTAVAFLVLAGYVASRMFGVPDAYFAVFAPAAFFLGSFVFFLGLLILSSKWYEGSTYLIWNALMLIAAFVAIWLGNTLGIPELAKMGGSFLVLWILEKWFEIPLESILGYSFLTAIACLIGYFSIQSVMADPTGVGRYLFFVS